MEKNIAMCMVLKIREIKRKAISTIQKLCYVRYTIYFIHKSVLEFSPFS